MNDVKIPAPERDMKNVEPHVPPASRELSPVTRGLFSSLAIGFGIAVLALAIFAGIMQTSPLPQDYFNSEDLVAVLLAAGSGLCLIGCGIGIARRSTVLAVVLLLGSLLCGMAATAIA
ncbi:hypothetical protein Mal4_52460 [Maioricimonas rarisocia]|uniref:Uncharacterized protein n=1 Tax=Maioricimonas rarisocia TaxID=2528026 RepID=A0A517ZEF1_9PLAN|nr:hypothetical protein [Maioricimonas rarisocia]QDU40883.1 hypothetical protein Mal4_52460 [Maioricimonas rarisocia]